MGGFDAVPFDGTARRRALERMAEAPLDVLVVGGGIVGCGVALDAASRGLTVGLVEREDFASGTSGRSSRLVHGGVRYLAQRELGLVREAQRERAILLRLAPHLVQPIDMTFPIRGRGSRALVRTGLVLYDLLALGHSTGRHARIGEDEVARRLPGLGRRAPALVYHECTTDDARLTLEVARAAAAHGALVANHARFDDGRVTDATTGEAFEPRARTVVDATGVWSAPVASKGVHVVFRPGAIVARTGAVIPSADDDGRLLFVIPWEDRVYVGTTDTRYEGPVDDPRAGEEDVGYVLRAVARAFPDVGRDDVLTAWAGLRPLADASERPTADLSRRHVVTEEPGRVAVTGGKLTTYRAMAEDVVDRLTGAPCRTRGIPLGFTGRLDAALAEAGPLARLVHRYGDGWRAARDLVRERPELGEPVADGVPVLRVELELARTREMALTEEDVLVRRTRLTTFSPAASPG